MEIEFLELLLDPPSPVPLTDLPHDDRLFLGGIVHRLHTRTLDIPVIPDVAIRLTDLLRRGDVPVAEYAALLNRDAALTAEVLRASNSALYGSTARVTSAHEAILRIGLARVHALLVVTHLKARVVKGGILPRLAELLLDLSFPLAHLAGRLSAARGGSPEADFMRGMFVHVEHLVILGAVADIARQHRAPLHPSTAALVQAFARYGPDVRHAVGRAWQLEDLLASSPSPTIGVDYGQLREAIIARWLDRPLQVSAHGEANLVPEVLAQIAPRL